MMKNESGRSMVEMLGVLAIIGVLSVGGIAGYTMAMNKYKANEIVAAAAQCAILARSYNQGAGVGTTAMKCSDLGATVPSTLTDASFTASGTDTITVATGVTDTAISKAIKGITGRTDVNYVVS